MTTIKSKVEKQTSHGETFSYESVLKMDSSDSRMCVTQGQFVLITNLDSLATLTGVNSDIDHDTECEEFLRRVNAEITSVAKNSQCGRVTISIQSHFAMRLSMLAMSVCAQEQMHDIGDFAYTIRRLQPANDNIKSVHKLMHKLVNELKDVDETMPHESDGTPEVQIELLFANSTERMIAIVNSLSLPHHEAPWNQRSELMHHSAGSYVVPTKGTLVAIKVDADYGYLAQKFVQVICNDAALFHCLSEKAEIAFDDDGHLSGALRSLKCYQSEHGDDDDDDEVDHSISQPKSKKQRTL